MAQFFYAFMLVFVGRNIYVIFVQLENRNFLMIGFYIVASLSVGAALVGYLTYGTLNIGLAKDDGTTNLSVL